MIPAPVIAEYFAGASETELEESEILKRGFEIPVLDLPSAILAARLQRGGVAEAIRDEFGIGRQQIRVDAFIVAIAIVNGADSIVTNDVKAFRKLASGLIIIDGVTEPNLFRTSDTEEMDLAKNFGHETQGEMFRLSNDPE